MTDEQSASNIPGKYLADCLNDGINEAAKGNYGSAAEHVLNGAVNIGESYKVREEVYVQTIALVKKYLDCVEQSARSVACDRLLIAVAQRPTLDDVVRDAFAHMD